MNTLLVLFGKISDEIERYVASEPLRNLFYQVVKMIFVVFAASVTAFPRESWALFYIWFSYSNFFAPKFAFFWVMTYKVYPVVRKLVYGDPDTCLIEGIPISELVDHIFSESSFKRDEIERKFALPRNRYQSIANRLDELGVFKRGDNNARELQENFKREDLVRMLREGGESDSNHSPPPSVAGFVIRKLQSAWIDRTKPDLKPIWNPMETE